MTAKHRETGRKAVQAEAKMMDFENRRTAYLST